MMGKTKEEAEAELKGMPADTVKLILPHKVG